MSYIIQKYKLTKNINNNLSILLFIINHNQNWKITRWNLHFYHYLEHYRSQIFGSEELEFSGRKNEPKSQPERKKMESVGGIKGVVENTILQAFRSKLIYKRKYRVLYDVRYFKVIKIELEPKLIKLTENRGFGGRASDAAEILHFNQKIQLKILIFSEFCFNIHFNLSYLSRLTIMSYIKFNQKL